MNVLKLLSDIHGLKYIPKIESESSPLNDSDSIAVMPHLGFEVSYDNFSLLSQVVKERQKPGFGILEIGVARANNGNRSFTHAIFGNKLDGIKYLGVDIDDKSFLDNPSKNIFTLKSSSFEQKAVRNRLIEVGIDKLSILIIDGWHSVNAVVNDFRYSDLLEAAGVVVFHDTNFHPGPSLLLHSLDEKIYSVTKYFQSNDFGMAVAIKQ